MSTILYLLANHWNLLALYAMESFGASEAVKDIYLYIIYHSSLSLCFSSSLLLGQVFRLFICITTGGRFSSYWCLFLLVACLVWAACLPGLSSLPLVSFLSLGVFFLFKFGKGVIILVATEAVKAGLIKFGILFLDAKFAKNKNSKLPKLSGCLYV
jgi:hypothetical protein